MLFGHGSCALADFEHVRATRLPIHDPAMAQGKPLGAIAVAHKNSYSNNVERSGAKAPHGPIIFSTILHFEAV
jgi:hypothetical protein